MRNIVLTIFLALALLVIGVFVSTQPTSAANPPPSAYFSPTNVATTLLVSGTNWSSNETILRVTVNGVAATSFQLSVSAGNLSGTLNIPSQSGSGATALNIAIVGSVSLTQNFTLNYSTLRDLTNGDFESGTLNGWCYSDVSISQQQYITGGTPIDPHDGRYFALLQANLKDVPTQIWRTFDASPNQTIHGWVYFASGDYTPYNDLAKVVVIDGARNTHTIFQSDSKIIGGVNASGWIPWAFTFDSNTSGSSTIVASVTNIGDSLNQSMLAIDGIVYPYSSTNFTLKASAINGTVQISGVTADSNGVYSTTANSSPLVTLTASPLDNTYQFAGWSGSYTNSTNNLLTDETIKFNLDSDKTLIAAFTKNILPSMTVVSDVSPDSISIGDSTAIGVYVQSASNNFVRPPTGHVVIYASNDPSQPHKYNLGPSPDLDKTGSTQLTINPQINASPLMTAAGTYLITAEYVGDSFYSISTSSNQSVSTNTLTIVTQGNSQTNLTSPINSVVYGTEAIFNATVSSSTPGKAVPTGSVTFSANGTAYVATVTLVNGVTSLSSNSFIPDKQTVAAPLPVPAGGIYSILAVYSGDTNYKTSSAGLYVGSSPSYFYVAPATPVITWPNPADIVFGAALSGTQLNATASVAGTFAYTPAAGTVLNAGSNQTLSATFTPADTTDYNTNPKSASINVLKATPVITWAPPADIVFGATLSGTQLNATANVAGTFAYTPAAGIVLNAGSNQTLSVTFTPADIADYNSASGSLSINVLQATPGISWAVPSPIVYGTPLSGTQLNATAGSVVGTFVYNPVSGAVLNAGQRTLSVTFTPSDRINYSTVSGNVSINVTKASLTVTVDNVSMATGRNLPVFTAKISGYVNNDTSSAVTGAPLLTTTANISSSTGTYPITIALGNLAAANYTFNLIPGTLTITNNVSITLSNLTQTYDGTPKPAIVTTIPSGVNCSVTYNGSSTAPTNAGSYNVVATVTDPNYTGTVTGTLIINKATATVALSNLTQTYTGSPLTPTATTTPSGLPITWTGAPQTNAGSYQVTATINNANYQGSASGTFTINKAPATVVLSNLTQTYDGTPKPATVTTTPSGLSRSVTYSGSSTAPTNAGSYNVVATVIDPNYTGTVTGTLTINKAATTLTITSSNTLPNGSVTVTAVLKRGVTPISGETVAFNTTRSSGSGTTDINGVASATLSLSPGQYVLNASFAGDNNYLSSNAAAQTFYVYQPTQFVIWGGNPGCITNAQDYNFWGSQWDKQVKAGKYDATASFKGCADQVSGTNWTSGPGNSIKPPAIIAPYISVIISTNIKKTGNTISGDVAGIAIVQVDNPNGYSNNPGHPGSGVVVAIK